MTRSHRRLCREIQADALYRQAVRACHRMVNWNALGATVLLAAIMLFQYALCHTFALVWPDTVQCALGFAGMALAGHGYVWLMAQTEKEHAHDC